MTTIKFKQHHEIDDKREKDWLKNKTENYNTIKFIYFITFYIEYFLYNYV